METEKKKPIIEISQDTRVLAARLSKVEPEQTVKYESLSVLIGRDVRGRSRYVLSSARRMVEREHGIVFGAVMGVGLKRLLPEQIPAVGESAIKSISRKAGRASRTMLRGTEGKTLDNESKIKLHATLAGLGVIRQFSKKKAIEKIESAVKSNETAQLSIGRTLELFKNGS